MKIIQQLNETDFVIRVDRNETITKQIAVAHDYIQFFGGTTLHTEHGMTIQHSPNFSSNTLFVPVTLQFDIRSAQKVILPFLQNHKYLQPEHLADRSHHEDDPYFMNVGASKPRWKKGDLYPAYAYSNAVICYYDSEKKTAMVAVRLAGEAEYNHVSRTFFEKFIKPNL